MADGTRGARRAPGPRVAAPRRVWRCALALLALGACEPDASAATAEARAPVLAQVAALPDSVFGALSARLSEPGGYFDTDNLISNEAGYLKVIGALEGTGLSGGAYMGVGPDQNYSYVARLRPEIVFMVDIRRDNLLQHLLLKALVERSATRVEFLAALHGRPAPDDPAAWTDRPVDEVVAWVDGREADPAVAAELREDVATRVSSAGIALEPGDLETVARFHDAFVRAGPGLRFTSFGRAPRPYYPTYRQLVTETDLDGEPASWLAGAEAYRVVRDLHLANRIVPMVGDLAGPSAVREAGRVMREMGVELTAFYVSNVEYYLVRAGTLQAWLDNLGSLPAAEDAVLIRSYFPNFGGVHPSAVPGYHAVQSLQPVSVATRGGFGSYWELATRGVLPLR